MCGKRDSMGRFFAIMEETRGECLDIVFGSVSGSSGKPLWKIVPHREADGMAGFVSVLEAGKLRGEADVPDALERRLRWWQWPLLLWHLPKHRGPHSGEELAKLTSWTEVYRGDHRPQARAFVLFSAAETRKLQLKAKLAGISLNSFLLSRLHILLHRQMTDGNGSLVWFLPVNLRPYMSDPGDRGNGFSPVFVRLKDESAELVQARVSEVFRRRLHWATWLAMRWADRLGLAERMRKKPRKTEFHLGRDRKFSPVFSNLGRWMVTNGRGKPDIRYWLFCPPATISTPVVIGALTVNDCLSLTMQSHPALRLQSAELKNFLSGVKRSLIRD